jgi:hypothetical protein
MATTDYDAAADALGSWQVAIDEIRARSTWPSGCARSGASWRPRWRATATAPAAGRCWPGSMRLGAAAMTAPQRCIPADLSVRGQPPAPRSPA